MLRQFSFWYISLPFSAKKKKKNDVKWPDSRFFRERDGEFSFSLSELDRLQSQFTTNPKVDSHHRQRWILPGQTEANWLLKQIAEIKSYFVLWLVNLNNKVNVWLNSKNRFLVQFPDSSAVLLKLI